MRNVCDTLTRNFDVLEVELNDKVGRRQMDSAVHKKYEDIVQYLKTSIDATGQDEKKFEKKIEEFQSAVQVSFSFC